MKRSSELQHAIADRPVLVILQSAQCLRINVLEHSHSLVIAASARQLDRPGQPLVLTFESWLILPVLSSDKCTLAHLRLVIDLRSTEERSRHTTKQAV
jgi:hypothetical protein